MEYRRELFFRRGKYKTKGVETMGFRKYKRQIAKHRLKALGFVRVNKVMSQLRGGVKVWRIALANPEKKNRRKK